MRPALIPGLSYTPRSFILFCPGLENVGLTQPRTSFNQRLLKQSEYFTQVKMQYFDRTVYWAHKELSIQTSDSVSYIIDGMDRSKYRLPRLSPPSPLLIS